MGYNMVSLKDVAKWLEVNPGVAMHISVTRGKYLVWLICGGHCVGLAASHALEQAIHEAIEYYEDFVLSIMDYDDLAE